MSLYKNIYKSLLKKKKKTTNKRNISQGQLGNTYNKDYMLCIIYTVDIMRFRLPWC